MDVGQVKEGDLVILTPEGDISAPQDCTAIERALSAAIGGGARSVVIDCAKATQISAAAIRLLLLSQKRLTVQRGSLVLCGLSAATRKAFAISGFDRDFTIAATRQEAASVSSAIADSRKRAPGAAKAAADAKAAPDARPPAGKPATEAKPPGAAKGEAEPKPAPAVKAASDVKPAPPAKAAPEVKPAPPGRIEPAATPPGLAAAARPPAVPAPPALPQPGPLANLVAHTLGAGLPAAATIAPHASPDAPGLDALADLVARTLAG